MSAPRAVQFWNVKVTPKKNRMIGTLVRAVGGKLSYRSRRLTIEIHNAESEALEDLKESGCVRPSKTSLLRCTSSFQSTGDDSLLDRAGGLRQSDKIMIRILRKPRKKIVQNEDLSILNSVRATMNFGTETDSLIDALTDDEIEVPDDLEGEGWLEHRRYVLDAVVILKQSKKSATLQLGQGGQQAIRQVIFPTEDDAILFCNEIELLVLAFKERAEQNIVSFRTEQHLLTSESGHRLGDVVSLSSLPSTLHEGDRILILVEVVAAYNLPRAAENRSVSPYVSVFMGQEKVHRTKSFSKTSNPIWTVASDSLFLLDTTAEEFFHSSGLTFHVKDIASLGRNDLIGKFTVPHKVVLGGTGKRNEYPLYSNRGETMVGSCIVVRFRPAEPEDVDFMKRLTENHKAKRVGIHATEAFLPPKCAKSNILKRQTRPSRRGTEYRVRPGPDPTRKDSTQWMTKEDIGAESKKQSSSWIAAGSGEAGKLYFELLGCDGLPNTDTFSKDDCFACVIYEDAIVNTEVIMDSNSPRWMPWTQRAFIFNVHHPSSQVLVGIFDQDTVKSSDEIGRVAIDVSNFAPLTEYTLTFELHLTSYLEKRTKTGTVTVRLWIEWMDYRKAFRTSLGLPKSNYINTQTKHDFRAAHFTAIGQENIHSLDLVVLKSYVQELKSSVKHLKRPIKKAATEVVLWRGHCPVHLTIPWLKQDTPDGGSRFSRSLTVFLPLHSMTAFIFGVLLVEDLNYIPSVFLFSIAWLFLANMEQQRSHPSPWHRCRSFSQMWRSLLSGEPISESIEPFENLDEIRMYEANHGASQWGLGQDEKTPDDLVAELMAQEEQENKKSGVVRQIESKRGGSLLDIAPLQKLLLPIQLKLGKVCVAIRITKSFLSWNAFFYSFLITNMCLALGFVALFVKWDFIVRWFFRVVVWVFLGPWMKLVDIYYVKRLESHGENHVHEFLTNFQSVVARTRSRRTRDENVLKLRDFKSYLFGKYLTKLPVLKEYRYRDFALPCSSAKPCDTQISEEDIVAVMHGQYVVQGNMIPRWKKIDREARAHSQHGAHEVMPQPTEKDPLLPKNCN